MTGMQREIEATIGTLCSCLFSTFRKDFRSWEESSEDLLVWFQGEVSKTKIAIVLFGANKGWWLDRGVQKR